MLQHRRLRERALGPQESDLERLLLRQAGGHDFAKQPRDFFVAQRPLIALERQAQNLGFPLGAIEIDRLARCGLGNADQLGEARALIEQRMNSRIDGIDAVADVPETAAGGLHPRPALPRPAPVRGALFFLRALARWCFTAWHARTLRVSTLEFPHERDQRLDPGC